MAERLWLAPLLLAACAETSSSTAPAPTTTSIGSASTMVAPPTSATATATAGTTSSIPPTPCGHDMVLASGSYCPKVKHTCLEHTQEYRRDVERRKRLRAKGVKLAPSPVSERCLRYQQPSQCLSTQRRPMRFCIDEHEWPNRPGQEPLLLVTWLEAKAHCEQAGKRLCTADEFNFACEGEQMLPYSYGYNRDAERCNIDKPYVKPKRLLLPHAACQQRDWCKKHLAELDQRVPSATMTACTSPFGAFDLNGNVNEWVSRPDESAPNRSGLKGGWWGPARSRCRPMVTVHKESYVGYEVGFRCCSEPR